MPIIEFQEVNKTYKRTNKKAISNFSLKLEKGQILGVLGPNGAGKSTFIKLLAGIIKKDTGNISVFGKDPENFKNKDLSRIGVYMTGKSNLIELLPAIDSLRLTKSIYKIPKDEYKKNIEEYSKLLDCADYLKQPVNTLSIGQRLRVELLNTLIHNPELIILDEPTNGLDIEGKRNFNLILRRISSLRDKTIIVATHDVLSANKLCDFMIFLKKGEKLLEIDKKESDDFINSYRVVETDGEFMYENFQVKILPHINEMNRILILNEDLKLIQDNLNKYFKNANSVNFIVPNLEDMLYEYYI